MNVGRVPLIAGSSRIRGRSVAQGVCLAQTYRSVEHRIDVVPAAEDGVGRFYSRDAAKARKSVESSLQRAVSVMRQGVREVRLFSVTDKPFFASMRETVIQAAGNCIEQFVDLRVRNDQRWRQGDRVTI